jgi:hypothetical protein
LSRLLRKIVPETWVRLDRLLILSSVLSGDTLAPEPA